MKTILLLTSDKLQPVQRLATRTDVKVIPMIASKYAGLYADFEDVVELDDIADVSAATRACAEALRKTHVDYVLAVTDRAMPTGGWLRTHFGFPGMTADIAQMFSNKVTMKTRLTDAAIPCARFTRIGHPRDLLKAGETLGWPVVIKPATASGTVDVWKIDSAAELQQLLDAAALATFEHAASALIAEEYVDIVNEYHVDAIVRDDEVKFMAAFKYITPPLRARGSFYGATLLRDDDAAVKPTSSLLRRVVDAFGLRNGVVHLEIFDTRDGFIVGEVASRPGGAGSTELIDNLLGVDVWDAFISAHLDEPWKDVVVGPAPAGVHGYFGLPCRSGTVKRISNVDDLERIAGVRHARIFCRPGDVMKGKSGSAVFFAGVDRKSTV